MSKEQLKRLALLAAQDRIADLHREGIATIKANEEEIRRLQQENILIRHMLTHFTGAPVSDTGTIPMAPTAETSTAPNDGLSPDERSRLIRETALELARNGKTEMATNDIVQALLAKSIRLSVKRPASTVGTVLRFSKEFKRISFNRYQYMGSNTPGKEEGRTNP